MIKSRQLAKALYELSEDKTQNIEEKFLKFTEQRNLKAQLPQVLYHLEKIAEREKEKRGIVIEVAHSIKSDTIMNIKKHLKVENLSEVVRIKPELIGGFRAKYAGNIYDSSIETGLKKLEEIITK